VYIASRETRRCPAEFQNRLTRRCGKNPFGDPLFKIVWGASEFIRMGNIWRDKRGTERRGFKERYLCHGMPCWNIVRWRSAKEYGSQEHWYSETWDSVSKLNFLGEYPWRGRYEVVQPLMHREFVDGKMIIKHMPLSHLFIDELIPLLLQIDTMSKWQRKAAEEMCRIYEARRKQKEVDEVAEKMAENIPAWYGPVSFSGQGCRTSLLDRKINQIEQAIGRLTRAGKKPVFQKGFTVGNAPRIAGRV